MESLTGQGSGKDLGIGSGSIRKNNRFLMFPDSWRKYYPMLMHVHHFITVICRLQHKTNTTVSCWKVMGSKVNL